MTNRERTDVPGELFRRAVEGDSASLDQLIESYVNYLTALSRSHLDKRIQHRVSPSDIVQETLLEAHRDFSNFRGANLEEFTGWLRQVLVHNLASAVGKHVLAAKRSIHQEQLLGNLSDSVDPPPRRLHELLQDQGRSPGSEAIHRESLSRLTAVLEKLPDDYRTVIVLRHLEGLAFDEVAERMQRTTGAVRMLWLRAIEQLRALMEMKT